MSDTHEITPRGVICPSCGEPSQGYNGPLNEPEVNAILGDISKQIDIRPADSDLTFSTALTLMQKGFLVRRKSWPEKKVHLRFQNDMLILRRSDTGDSVWLPLCPELLAEDWVVTGDH